MARIRTIKPEFFRHESLYEAEKETGLPLRIAFAGLWSAADREGRFRWSPRQLKLDCLPYDELDFSRVLDALADRGFIRQYSADGSKFGYVPSWKSHQVINMREAKSKLPEPPDPSDVNARARTVIPVHEPRGVNIPEPLRQTVIARDGACVRCSSKNDLTVDHIFPRSMGGTHAITNLRTLCRSCNSGRPVAGQALIDDLAKDGLTLADMQRTCTHVQACGEGKGREGEREGKGYSEADASGAGAPLDPAIPNREYFMRGREVLGPKSGGLLGKLLKAKGGNVALARAAIEQASQKANPTEYIAACCLDRSSKTLTPYQQEIQETRNILDGLKAYSQGSDRRGGENPRLLSYDHS